MGSGAAAIGRSNVRTANSKMYGMDRVGVKRMERLLPPFPDCDVNESGFPRWDDDTPR